VRQNQNHDTYSAKDVLILQTVTGNQFLVSEELDDMQLTPPVPG
jgi:hypothetical protein